MLRERACELARALESGEYTQGSGGLHPNKGTHCCLGVECELAIQAGAVSDWDNRWNNGACRNMYFLDNDAFYLPDDVMKYAGMHDTEGRFRNPETKLLECITWDGTRYGSLVQMNDMYVPFSEIAKVVRKYYKWL